MSAVVNWPAETDQHFAEISSITGQSIREWKDVLTEDESDQKLIVESWIALDKIGWTVRPDQVARVFAILNVIATIAGVVSGVGGAVSAVQVLAKGL